MKGIFAFLLIATFLGSALSVPTSAHFYWHSALQVIYQNDFYAPTATVFVKFGLPELQTVNTRKVSVLLWLVTLGTLKPPL
ncbi:hypothetical protein [Enterovibrio coralii]|uniref:Uncharacterized protein n=1 Tax=Enterovibrio coralii TaxID=294935 RepID=A0A135IBX9_9GAMM|nr:hypothetical protein [Enterovibrio coralii]KXF82973.1 hypothetical protein ATN88_04265 [Enterovibrio coralii]